MNAPGQTLGSGHRPINPAIAKLAFGSDSFRRTEDRSWPEDDLDIDLDDPDQRTLGEFVLLGILGEGGMGRVYRALQVRLDREVAVKLLSAGPWAPPESVERFRKEAQHAARLQHPAIVAVYEMGEIEGLVYYAMELVRGTSLAQQLRERGAALEAQSAARLAKEIAEAVAYAHSLDVLHLDLKPANVLIGETGAPKIADFGLARRLDQNATAGQSVIAGTPGYMAPEQASGGPLTAATDIWGLGAILYETLCGHPPFESNHADGALRLLRDGIVRKPSRYLRISSDLEAICMKCLRKLPEQRYSSARELAEDLNRFLEDRPVLARAAGAPERFRRWTRRQPLLAAMCCATLFSLASGLSISLWLWRRAENNAIMAREVNAALKGMLTPDDAHLSLANPSAQMTTRDLFARLENRLNDGTVYEPHIRAELELSVGHAYFAIGAWTEARKRLGKTLAYAREHLGPDSPLTLDIEQQYGLALVYDAQYAEASRIYEHLVAEHVRIHGRDHPSTIAALHGQALLYYESDQFATAEKAFLSLREAAQAHAPERLSDIDWTLSDLHAESGRWKEAESLLQSTLVRSLELYGPRHPNHISQRVLLGDFRMMHARWDEAEAIFDDILKILQKDGDSRHPTALTATHYLATVQLERGRPAEALPRLTEVLKARTEIHGPDHSYTLYTMNRVGQALIALQKHREAQVTLEQALDAATRTGKRRQAFVLLILDNLAQARMATRDLAGAESAVMEAIQNAQRLHPNNMRRGMLQETVGELRFRQHRFDEARMHLLEAARIMTVNFGPNHPQVSELRARLDDLEKPFPNALIEP